LLEPTLSRTNAEFPLQSLPGTEGCAIVREALLETMCNHWKVFLPRELMKAVADALWPEVAEIVKTRMAALKSKHLKHEDRRSKYEQQ